jgi:hypothetical protein
MDDGTLFIVEALAGRVVDVSKPNQPRTPGYPVLVTRAAWRNVPMRGADLFGCSHALID